VIRLEHLCDSHLRYEGDVHLVRPYGGESGTVETAHPSYAWLNDVVCVAQGRLDAGMRAEIVVWECRPDG
jgi:hypothetical protein